MSRLGPAGQLSRLIFAGRWLLVPVYLGLLVAMCLVVAKSVLTLVAAAGALPGMDVGAVLLLSLKLIDLALVANLLLMVALGGWESFVTPVLPGDDPHRPEWLGHMDFTALKAKVIGSVAAIAAIDLLENFLTTDAAGPALLARVAVLLAFALTGVLLALADRLGRGD